MDTASLQKAADVRVPDGYVPVFCDDFSAGGLDLEKWAHRAPGPRRGGFNSPSQVKVENGFLVLRADWKDGEYGPGWYAGMLSAKKRFLRGWFEIRCICADNFPKGDSVWSAFWAQARHPYEPELSRGGPGGAEIDFLETFADPDGTPCAESAIHVSGMKESKAAPGGLDSLIAAHTPVPDACSAFHVYACEWTTETYRFFVDGKLTAETSWGDGVSEEDNELVVSLELPNEIRHEPGETTEMIVDYVRVFQKKDDVALF